MARRQSPLSSTSKRKNRPPSLSPTAPAPVPAPGIGHNGGPELLMEDMARFRTDPYGFVLYSYPWGVPGMRLAPLPDGTIPTPDDWQIDVLEYIGEEVRKREGNIQEAMAAIKLAVASGHGVGKTALVAWLLHWFVSCFPFPQIKVTAGTFAQLTGKTWRELAVWHNMSVQEPFFKWTATRFYLKDEPETWFAEAIPWSAHNSDSFAGTHEYNVLYLFDEGSTIDDVIWEVSEGAMTTQMCLWIVFGNPVRNTGRFKECFTKRRKYWKTFKVDSRTARMTNKAQLKVWEEEYGEDSDWFRTRVRGEFPRQSAYQLVSEEWMDRCRTLVVPGQQIFPIRISCDVARFGSDDTTIMVLQGRKALEAHYFHHKNTVQIYTKLVALWNYYRQRHDNVVLFVDDIGVGGGVVDMLGTVNGMRVIGVDAGAGAIDPDKYLNLRMEMWWNAAQAVKAGVDFTALEGKFFDRLKDDMINIEYIQSPSTMVYQLESVKSLKDRGLPSPDYATAFVMSLAYPVPFVPQSTQGQGNSKSKGGSSVRRRRRE